MTPSALAGLITLIDQGTISSSIAKDVFAKAKPGYHPITTGSVQDTIANAKPVAPPAPEEAPETDDANEMPGEMHSGDPTKPAPPAATK